MRTLLVLCGVLALIGASLSFKSEKLQKPKAHVTADYIYNGTFRTRVDHFRAQDGRTVDFVRSYLWLSKIQRLNNLILLDISREFKLYRFRWTSLYFIKRCR